jgi:hypothetical protein
MNTIKIIGTREEVYKSQAKKTIGGLTKPDILEKCNNGKTTYISKKLSDKMRLQINTIRENNPNFFKNKKRTHCVSSIHKNSNSNSINNNNSSNNTNNNNNSNNTNYKNKKKSKTHKLSFEINNNKVKNIYYPELNGLNIEELKEEIRRQEEEENEEDEFENIEEFESLNELTEVFSKPPTQKSVNNTKNTNFVIEELSDEVDNFNINSL